MNTAATPTSPNSSDPLLISVENGIGVIIMNRPEVLNALTVPMLRSMQVALDTWRDDPNVHAVLLKGVGKAFCSGGDIVAVQEASIRNEPDINETFFREEYDLNHTISEYPKPYISLINGYCMGGGMGVCIHGSHRVVTEKCIMAMPETAIGFFPDVGGTHFLPRLPGRIGMYLGLTGARVSPADAMYSGLATHFVASEKLDELETAIIADPKNAVAILDQYNSDAGNSDLETNRAEIDLCFAANTPEENVVALKANPSEFADKALKYLRRLSPYALRLSAELIVKGEKDDLRTCLDRELDISDAATRHPDFIEGVRSVLVDKDRNPKWTSDPIE